MNYKVLAERLNVCPLTEEEKQKRGILGRLFGPIATSLERTRNGRKYNKELWERALNDELFNEKIANKCLFLELGHPVDREDVDMTKVCACIPEMPKIIDGDLCAYVDILNTPNGKILKTLCDYGFVPGISSRGSGDVLANDDVDPETFFLETFDIVNIPAVKKARLSMCESLNATNSKSLKQALTESLSTASQEDQAIMKEALDNLNIEVEDTTSPTLTEDDIPWASDAFEDSEVLVEADEDIVAEDPEADLEEGIFGSNKNSAEMNNARRDFETQVKRITDSSLHEIAYKLGRSLNNSINEYRIAYEDHDHHTSDRISLSKVYESRAKQILGWYQDLIKTLKKPNNWSQGVSAVTRTCTKILGDFADDSQTLYNLQEYPQQMLQIAKIDADKRIIKEQFKKFYETLVHTLESDLQFLKKRKPHTLFKESLSEEAETEVDEVSDPENADFEDLESGAKETPEGTESNETEANTIGEFIELLSNYDSDLNLVIEIVDEDEVEHTYDAFTITETEDTLKISAIRSAAEDADEAGAEDIYELEETEEEIPETGDEAPDEPAEAEDTGDEEVIESLKDLVRQNTALEEEAKTLRAEKAVGDAKVEELQEELDKYKAAFSRVSTVAASSKKLSRKLETLQEQLSAKDAENSTLKTQIAKARQLKESVDNSNSKVQSLTEALAKEKNERNALEESYKAKLASSEAKLNSRTETAKKYKARFTEAMSHYITNKADMLGVDPTEITSKLSEAYTVSDVDAICEQLMTSASFSRLPFGGITRSKACIKEPARAKTAPKSPEYGYDIDDSLLELAGLK